MRAERTACKQPQAAHSTLSPCKNQLALAKTLQGQPLQMLMEHDAKGASEEGDAESEAAKKRQKRNQGRSVLLDCKCGGLGGGFHHHDH